MTLNPEISNLARRCAEERAAFRKHQDSTLPSPACLELFRLTVNGNQDALHEICKIIEPIIRGWLPDTDRLSDDDIEDILSHVFTVLSTGANQDFVLPENGQLAPVMKYLRSTTRNAALGKLRRQSAQKRKPTNPLVPLDEIRHHGDRSESAEIVERVSLRQQIDQILEGYTDKERLLYYLKFEWGFTPKEIQQKHPEVWQEYNALETDIKRITLRLRKELSNFRPTRRKDTDSALLQIVMSEEQNKQGDFVDEPCTLSEETLLEYVMGLAKSEVVALIETSPACLLQAQQLAADLYKMEASLFRLHCPDDELLVRYVERSLSGTQRLLVYQHLAQCPHCLKEAEMISKIAQQMVEDGQTSFVQKLRRVIEAIYTPPLQMGLMGEWLHYRTPEVFINISTRQSRSKERSWNVRVQVRTHEGKLLTSTVESALLERKDQDEAEAHPADSPIDGNSIAFSDVQSGSYCLSIALPEEEIIIRDIAVGLND